MTRGHGRHPHRLHALAAWAALRLAARRAPNWRAAWRPIELYWGQKRKWTGSAPTSRATLAARAIWLPRFHLHITTRVKDHRRTIIEFSQVLARLRCDPRLGGVSLPSRARSASSGEARAVEPRTSPIRSFVAPSTPGGALSRVLGRAQALSPRRSEPDVGQGRPAAIPQASLAGDGVQRGNPTQTRPRARWRPNADAWYPTRSAPPTHSRTPRVLHLRPAVKSSAPSTGLPVSSAQRPSVPPQPLVWRHPEPPAAGHTGSEGPSDPRELTRPALGRSLPGQDAPPGRSYFSGHASAPPVMKLDSGLIDRLADDVIRRVEQRARINRERRGL